MQIEPVWIQEEIDEQCGNGNPQFDLLVHLPVVEPSDYVIETDTNVPNREKIKAISDRRAAIQKRASSFSYAVSEMPRQCGVVWRGNYFSNNEHERVVLRLEKVEVAR